MTSFALVGLVGILSSVQKPSKYPSPKGLGPSLTKSTKQVFWEFQSI